MHLCFNPQQFWGPYAPLILSCLAYTTCNHFSYIHRRWEHCALFTRLFFCTARTILPRLHVVPWLPLPSQTLGALRTLHKALLSAAVYEPPALLNAPLPGTPPGAGTGVPGSTSVPGRDVRELISYQSMRSYDIIMHHTDIVWAGNGPHSDARHMMPGSTAVPGRDQEPTTLQCALRSFCPRGSCNEVLKG
jgi:hypothetical protein